MSTTPQQLAILRSAGFIPMLDHLSEAMRADGVEREAAWLSLRGQLCSGAVPAFINRQGVPVPVPKERWFSSTTDGAGKNGKLALVSNERPPWAVRPLWAVSHDGVMNRPNLDAGGIPKPNHEVDPLQGVSELFDVFVRRSAKPDATAPAAAQSMVKQPAQMRKGGPPAKYDSVGFLIEAFRIAYTKPPASRAALVMKALEAYQRRGLEGEPSEEWAKLLVRRLWNELGADLGLPRR